MVVQEEYEPADVNWLQMRLDQSRVTAAAAAAHLLQTVGLLGDALIRQPLHQHFHLSVVSTVGRFSCHGSEEAASAC